MWTAKSLNNLATLYWHQGRYEEAAPLLKRAVAILEKALGPQHPDTATGLNNLAELYRSQGRFAEAEPLYKRALAIQEKALGGVHPSTATSLDNLAGLYRSQGRYTEAEPLYKRALAIWEKALGPEHPDTATSLVNLAELYRFQGRYAEAEPLYKRALAIQEEASGGEHPSTATVLSGLALLYDSQNRYAEAEPLLKQALTIYEKALGREHPDTAAILDSLANNYHSQGRYAEAEPLYKRALAITEKVLGPEHPDTAASLNDLAALYDSQGRYAEAEPLYIRALTIKEKTLGSEHPDIATSLNNLASQYRDLGRYGEAEPLFKRALAITEKVLRPEHPDTAFILDNLASTMEAQGQVLEALVLARRATAIHRARGLRAVSERSTGALSERRGVRYVFLHHVSLLDRVARKQPSKRTALSNEAFEVAQLAGDSGAARAVARMAARLGAGDDALAREVRARQDAVGRWRALDAALIKALSRTPDKRNHALESRLRAERDGLDTRITALDASLARDFPRYKELADPKPMTVAEVQALLGPHEALLSYLVGKKHSYLWVVRRDAAAMHLLEPGRKELDKRVRELRRGLDQKGVETLRDIRPFRVAAAHRLYQTIFAPAEPLLAGVRSVMIVPDGPLQSLPFGVLVTAEAKGPGRDLARYREIPWLAKRYALTTLPSVAALRALRVFAKGAPANKPFTGFGDPALEGEGGGQRGIDIAALFSRGAIADVGAVRELPSLPETAGELRAEARALGANSDVIHLGNDATESRVKSLDLRPYRVLSFATHGLVAGDLKGLAEPALVFTPPAQGSERDDGLLTASEVAKLKLNAEWVILSACNTAAPDGTPGAQGLSGLARAFFYAGSRALLVSHWAVSSDATVALTTGAFRALAADPRIGRAEALRRSMLALINDQDKPYYAHPMFWAPFVVVGEGAGSGSGAGANRP